MRIPIREQLGLLVLFCCLVCLAAISVATWITNVNFVTGVSLDSLSLTSSLYSQQLSSNLLLLQASVQSVATRVLIQNALSRYNDGNNTVENWARATSDLAVGLGGQGVSLNLLQGQIYAKNATGLGGPYSLVNVTGQDIPATQLPYNHPNGTPVFLGDVEDGGYPRNLYPNLSYSEAYYNSTYNVSRGAFNDRVLESSSPVFLGPWQINTTFALCSISVPIINNTSTTDVLGFLTIVVSSQLLFSVDNATLGLGETGTVLIVGPTEQDNKFPRDLYSPTEKVDPTLLNPRPARFVLPPVVNDSRSTRHRQAAFGQSNYSFTLQDFPAAVDAFAHVQRSENNAGSLLDTRNEENARIAAGYAMVQSSMVDMAVIIEQSFDEVVRPITNLRNVIVTCLFTTIGAILLFLFPVAHYSVRPIRLLGAATRKTVDPYEVSHSEDMSSIRTGRTSSSHSDADEENLTEVARKEGLIQRVSRWPLRRHRQNRKLRDPNDNVFRIPRQVEDRKHFIKDELTDLTSTFNEMSKELMMQYERLEQKVKERTMELELSKKAAEAANESKTLFIANISHELKTPLNGILGMCAVSMGEDDPTKIKRSLGIIYKSGDLLLNLLTDLLTFSKNQIGQQLSLDEKEFRLAEISSQVLSIFDKQAKEASVDLRVFFEGPNESLETASGTPGQPGFGPAGTGRVKDMCLWGDQQRILQVVINLVSNSLKFTPPGGSVTARIRCVGEQSIERMPSTSPKSSTNSKQSKTSLNLSGRNSRTRGRHSAASGSNSSFGGGQVEGHGKNIHTALEINSRDSKALPQVHVHERSTSPPPINSRSLLFEFEVEDTGPGIPPAQQQTVFEPFVQGDLGLSKKFGGTGLGLSICSQLATLMKGEITLHSIEGQGSTFTMRIPLRFIKERADSVASSSHPASIHNSIKDDPQSPRRLSSDADILNETNVNTATSSTLKGFESPASKPRLVGLSAPYFATSPPLETPKQQLEAMERVAAQASKNGTKVRVLVAEDNQVNQEVVLRMLKLEEIYDVTVAKDGQEAFDMVKESMEQENFFNLIFMDIQMPNLDGLQSTRLIRGMGFSAPIVALTAFAEESNVQECMESGMDFFLPKPIRRPALKQVLKRYCATIPEEAESPPLKEKMKMNVDRGDERNGEDGTTNFAANPNSNANTDTEVSTGASESTTATSPPIAAEEKHSTLS